MSRYWLVVLAVLVFTCSSSALAEEKGAYLFEQLEKPAYLTTFTTLFQGESNLEPWLERYIKDRNGVDTPGSQLMVNEQAYEAYQVCQPHNCPGNVLYVLFVAGGSRAYALFTKEDGSMRYFGQPDSSMQNILQDLSR